MSATPKSAGTGAEAGVQAGVQAEVKAGAAEATAFGHPLGLSVLFGTELWERFSYYGMRSLLVLYMTKHLLEPQTSAHVLGLEGFRRLLESVFGSLDSQAFASQVFGLYAGLVYLTPIFGGLLADRLLGRRITVVIGALLMAAGHFLMAFEPLFLVALLLLIVGNGAFKPNISSQVGRLYREDDSRRDRAYSIFYLGINIGAFLAPLVCGTLGERIGWDYGFAAAGVGMVLAVVIYLAGLRWLPADIVARRAAVPTSEVRASTGQVEPLSSPQAGAHAVAQVGSETDAKAVVAVLALFVPATLFWAVSAQTGNVLPLWIDASVDRRVALFGWQGELPTTWFQAINPLLIFVFTPLVVGLWAHQSARRREPDTVTKMALGCLLVAAAFALLAAVAWLDPGHPMSWLWIVVFFALATVGELYLSPIGLSLISKIAPVGLLSALMGVWLATSFTGSLIAGWFGTTWGLMAKPLFFLLCGVMAAIGAAIFMASRRFVVPLIGEEQSSKQQRA